MHIKWKRLTDKFFCNSQIMDKLSFLHTNTRGIEPFTFYTKYLIPMENTSELSIWIKSYTWKVFFFKAHIQWPIEMKLLVSGLYEWARPSQQYCSRNYTVTHAVCGPGPQGEEFLASQYAINNFLHVQSSLVELSLVIKHGLITSSWQHWWNGNIQHPPWKRHSRPQSAGKINAFLYVHSIPFPQNLDHWERVNAVNANCLAHRELSDAYV